MSKRYIIVDCETILDFGLGEHIPVEIAFVEFSFSRGYVTSFNEIIDPGTIPPPYLPPPSTFHHISHVASAAAKEVLLKTEVVRSDETESKVWVSLMHFLDVPLERFNPKLPSNLEFF